MHPMSPDDALGKARISIMQNHGDPGNRKHLLGFFEIQFGVVRHLSGSFKTPLDLLHTWSLL